MFLKTLRIPHPWIGTKSHPFPQIALDRRLPCWCCESRKSDFLVCLKFTRLAGTDKIVHYLEIWTWTAAEVLVQNTRSSHQRPCLVTHSLLICFAARSQYLWAGLVFGTKGCSKLKILSTSYQNVGMSRKKVLFFLSSYDALLWLQPSWGQAQ